MTPKLAPGVFHGARQLARQIAGLTLTEYQFAADHTIPKHCHEQSYLSLVLEGEWQESFGATARERKPLTLTVHPAGELHSERLGKSGARAFHVEFSAAWLRRLGSYAGVLTRAAQVEGGPLTWHALRLHAELRTADSHFPLIVEGIVLESIGELARSTDEQPRPDTPSWLAKVRDLLHARFAERLTLEDIATAVDVHPVHLARTFRRHCRSSIGDYVRRLRVQFACRELTASRRSLAEVALAAGFADQSHLSREVRRLTGMTPGDLRRAGRAR
jgi:AraC family transcriptional regulator